MPFFNFVREIYALTRRLQMRYNIIMEYMGFEPFANDDSKLLILGSFPSIKSREEGFYYGNRQNKFWRIVAESFFAELPQNIEEKKKLLSENGVALWDIVVACDIKGSMDKDIKNPVIADVPALLKHYPSIRAVITNGGTAKKLFFKYYPDLEKICLPLPSTSPANARLDKKIWIDALRAHSGTN